jgi:predicted DNA-binding protein YlxM (UPF0122 family)
VISSINALPESERTATTLFYINGYSMAEVSEFLEVSVSTVKNNLHSARKKLKRRYMAMMKDNLRQHAPGDDSNRRVRIVESIRDRHHPVIARGVVGPPEECMIVGYDTGGAVLVGWSYFQAVPELSEGVEFEPSGYFRKKGWFANTESIALIEGKVKKPPAAEIYNKALRWALGVSRSAKVKDDIHNGHAAYDAWSQALGRDEDLPADNMPVLRVNYHVHEDAVGTTAEGRWYGAQFLKQIAEDFQELSKNLLAAAKCYEAEHDLMWKMWALTGGPQRSDEGALKLADPENRAGMIRIIREARKLDEEACSHIDKALAQ